jgi:hypothetical protein
MPENLTDAFCCRLLSACIVAYANDRLALDPSTPGYARIGIAPGTSPAVFSDGPAHINLGFVAETADDWVIVAFRGTLTPHMSKLFAWVDDWLNDFRMEPMPWRPDGHDYGHVEAGFGASVRDLWPFAEAALARFDLSRKKGIAITGHSKGGAMTYPAASLVRSRFPEVEVGVCAFAAPMTCDQRFREQYARQGLDDVTVRYQNRFDVVPFLPFLPHLGLLSAIEHRLVGANDARLTQERLAGLRNDYVHPGRLRYLKADGSVATDAEGERLADRDLRHALEHLEFERVLRAHSAGGDYDRCICGTTNSGAPA